MKSCFFVVFFGCFVLQSFSLVYADDGRDPSKAHEHVLAGDLAFVADDLGRATEAWNRALAADPRLRAVKERLLQVEQERELVQVFDNGEFRIHLPPRGPGDSHQGDSHRGPDLRRLAGQLRAARHALEQRLQAKFDGPVRVLVYDPVAFDGSFHVPTERAGLFDGAIRLRLARVTDREPDRAGWPSLDAVIAHELAHVAVHQFAGGRAPQWVYEGLAQAAQQEIEPLSMVALRIAIHSRTAPSLYHLATRSHELGQPAPVESGVFYQTAWAHMAHLVQLRGWTGAHRFLQLLSANRPALEALDTLTGLDEHAWQAETLEWAQEQLDRP